MSKPTPQQEYFLKLYNPCHTRLSRFVSSMVWDTEDARDLMSETVMLAWQGFQRLKDEQAFLSFLFSIAHRLIKKHQYRNRLWNWLSLSNEDAMQVEDDVQSAEMGVDIGFFREALKHLKLRERETFVLFEISGLSLKEIQDIQGDSLSAVKSRLVRARSRIRKLMAETPADTAALKTANGQSAEPKDRNLQDESNIIVLKHAASGK